MKKCKNLRYLTFTSLLNVKVDIDCYSETINYNEMCRNAEG